jgi:hypothetical protein
MQVVSWIWCWKYLTRLLKCPSKCFDKQSLIILKEQEENVGKELGCIKRNQTNLVSVSHACNYSYLGGQYQEDCSSRPA